jgi:hypothetical protein
LRDLDSKKAQHTEVCEHFFESRSLKMRQISLFGERGEWLQNQLHKERVSHERIY